MRLVVDANILVAELIRKRGRELIIHPALALYMAQMAWEETCHELGKRVEKMAQKGVFSQEVGQNLLTDAMSLAEVRVSANTARLLQELNSTKHKVLLTKVPTNSGATDEQDARSWLQSQSIPVFNGRIRYYKAYDKAFIAGIPVFQVKRDKSNWHVSELRDPIVQAIIRCCQ